MYFRFTLLIVALIVTPINSYAKGLREIESLTEYQEALDAAGDKMVVVRVSSEHCGPCHASKPALKKISEMDDYKDVVFIIGDTDNVQGLSKKYNITGVPTTLFIINGEEVDRVRGSIEKGELMDRIERNLPKAAAKKEVVKEEVKSMKKEAKEEKKSKEMKKEKKADDKKSCKTCKSCK